MKTKTKDQIVLGIVIIGLILGFAAVIFDSGNQKQEQEDVIKIGFIGPLTGPFAEWAESIKNGAELAREDTKHKFEVDYQDDACEPKNALNVAHKFFDLEDIKLIIGPGCAGSLQAITPLAKQNNALLFSTGLLGDDTFKDNTNVVNLATQISTEAKVMADYLNSKNVKKVAIVHTTDLFGEEYSKRLPEFLKSLNITTTSNEPVNFETSDFKTVITKILQKNPDAIYINMGPRQMGIFAKQLKELGSETPIYSFYATETEETLKSGGNVVNGIDYTYPLSTIDDSSEKKNFEERYSKRFSNKSLSPTSYYVYDGMILLDKALDKCPSTDISCIKSFFEDYGVYNGVSGEMKFEKDGSITRPFGIKRIQDEEFVWVNKTIGKINNEN